MNLREFCQIPKLTSAILTTYNLDPLFFERVVLTDLAQGGTTRVVVLADADQALAAIARTKGQLLALGRRYRLIPIRTKGAFHPKVCIRSGPDAAAIACGSHNLTRAGWLGCRTSDDSGGNRELTVAWQASADGPAAASLVAAVRELSKLADNAADRDDILGVLPASWADAGDSVNTAWQWLVTGREGTLADALEARWRGRRFERIRVICGSTDDRGAMLRWASETFGVKEAIVEMDLTCCGFDPRRLSDLPLRLRLVPYNGRPRSHLKAVVFESADGCAAVVGSANCSGAAWLRRSGEFGNIESVVVYDRCEEADLSHLFRTGSVEPTPWEHVGLTVPIDANEDESAPSDHRLRQLQLHRAAGELLVGLDAVVPQDAKLIGVIQGSRVPLRPTTTRGRYVGPMPDVLEGPESLFGHVEWECAAGVERTNDMWIDDVDRLAEAAGRQHRFDSVTRLATTGASADYKRLLEDIHVLSQTLLFAPNAFPDASKRGPKDGDETDTEPAKPLTSADVIRTLDQLASPHQPAGGGSAYSGAVSLTGIMRLLFAEGDAGDDIDPTAAEHQRSEEEREQEQNEQSGQSAGTALPQTELGPTPAQRKRLLGQLRQFLDHLAEPSFSIKCSARQLQQAAAFPLAISRFASNGPWVEDGDRSALLDAVQRTCELLFFRRHLQFDPRTKQSRPCRPLIEEVRERYAADGRGSDFDQILGDGTLWLVLLGSLSLLKERIGEAFGRNLILRDVAKHPILSVAVMPAQLAALARRFNSNGVASPLEDAKSALERLDALEAHLDEHFDALRLRCAQGAKAGDWLWNRGVRFAQVVEVLEGGKAKVHVRKRAETLNNVMLSYYLNLRTARECDEELRRLTARCEGAVA